MATPGTFRQLHHGTEPLLVPNPWDAGSAVLLQSLGFAALATTSSGLAFSLGRPDGAIDRDISLATHAAICDATTIPVSADLEGGYGDSPAAVADTVTRAATVGLAGGSIEDFTGNPTRPLYDRGLAIERIAAAAEAARSAADDFVLTARFEGLLWTDADVQDAIDALLVYEAAGADVLFAPGLRSIDDIAAVCAALDAPVSVGLEMTDPPTVAELADAGVARISVGARFVRHAYGALLDAAGELLDRGTFETTADLVDYDDLETRFRR